MMLDCGSGQEGHSTRCNLALGTTRETFFGRGLRGALALAAHKDGALIGVPFAVVTFSIIVQGPTVPLLLKRAGNELAEPA